MENKILIVQSDDFQFIDRIADRVAEKLKQSIQPVSIPSQKEKTYLTRKDCALKLRISPPTVDQLVLDGILPKLGTGKRGRFRTEDVENLYENFNKYYRHSRPSKELKKEIK